MNLPEMEHGEVAPGAVGSENNLLDVVGGAPAGNLIDGAPVIIHGEFRAAHRGIH